MSSRLVAGTFAHHRPPGMRWFSVYLAGRSFGLPLRSAYKPGARYPGQVGASGSFRGRGWFLLLRIGRRVHGE